MLTARTSGSRSKPNICLFATDYVVLTAYSSFSSAVSRLFELGVPEKQWVSPEPWIIPTVDEQDAKKSA